MGGFQNPGVCLQAFPSSLPSPFPSPSFTHSIHRPVILCSRTAQKRLLRRLIARLHQKQIESHQVAEDPNKLRRRTKSAYNMFLVYCVLLCCYLPYSICLAVGKFTGYKTWNWIAINFTLTIVNINSSINPLIYCYRIREIRKAMSHTLYTIILRRRKAK